MFGIHFMIFDLLYILMGKNVNWFIKVLENLIIYPWHGTTWAYFVRYTLEMVFGRCTPLEEKQAVLKVIK